MSRDSVEFPPGVGPTSPGRRFVLSTAGHVYQGNTLVRALTGIDTDRLPEQKKRDITIEVRRKPKGAVRRKQEGALGG